MISDCSDDGYSIDALQYTFLVKVAYEEESEKLRGNGEKGLKQWLQRAQQKREKSVHSSLLSWALANDNNLSSSLFLDNEPQ